MLKSAAKPTPVTVTQLSHGRDLPLPSYATEDSAGMDLLAAIPTDITLAPLERVLVPTGIAIALPRGFEAQVRPRSGLAYKNGISILNSPGTIDADYRGEVGVILVNLSRDAFHITRGMRIAQLIIAPVARAQWKPAAGLSVTARGSGGFGSTGVKASAKKPATKSAAVRARAKAKPVKKTAPARAGKKAATKAASRKRASR